MIKAMIAILLITLSVGASAANLDGFEKRFKLVKNSAGEVTMIKMNFFNNKFSVMPYIKMVKEDIKAEIKRMKSPGFSSDLDELIAEMEESAEFSGQVAENTGLLRRSILGLKNVEIDEYFNKLTSSGVLGKFQKDLKDALALFSLTAIAKTDDAKYFYKRNVTYTVVSNALEYAKKKFSSVPMLNLATFVIVKVHNLVTEQRTFHQNMLLHYLANFNESELGLTKSEADRVFSSIFESRILPIMYTESKKAVANWDRYGTDLFYANVRFANMRLRRSGELGPVRVKLNHAFAKSTIKGVKVIVNIVDRKHSLSSKMPIAYYYDSPGKVKRFRSLLNLGQVGLGFIPLPNWLKKQAEGFMKSYYVTQKVTEGALVAHFEADGNMEMANKIVKQMGNPYLVY